MSISRTTLLRQCQTSLLAAICLSFSPLSFAQTPRSEPGSVLATPPDMTYFAQQGDTLSSIAKRFTDKALNWTILGKRNHIADDRAIPIGTAILIPLELLPEEESEAKVLAFAGNPTYKPVNGADTPLAIGTVVKEGAQIFTGKNGFITLSFPDNSRVSIPSNSQISFAKLRKTKYTASPRTEISLLEGKVESHVSSLTSNKGRFEVRSPLAVAGVRGTHFRVGVTTAGTANEVLEGGVAVNNPSLKKSTGIILPAGKGNIISASNVGKAVDLLPAPKLSEQYLMQVRPTIQFLIDKSEAATGYHVQISRDAQALDVLTENTFKDTRFKFDGVADGAYFVRIAAIDQYGLEGIPLTKAFTLKARPEPPFTVQPKNKIRNDKTDFVWTEASNAESYHLQVAKDDQFKDIVLDQSNLKDVQFSSDAIKAGNYFWRIATVVIQKDGKSDQGPFSDPQAFARLPAQTGAAFADSEGKEISFNWAAEPGQKFLIQIAKDPEFKTIYLARDTSAAELKIQRPDAGQYYIRVQATDPDGYVGAFSSTQKITIKARWVDSEGNAISTGNGTLGTGF
ncbi:FecR domain-containing protein [Undibacterium sp. Dicai25W]|uniref:FecR domain-containing protein n=1 Tax=Undibacterium sp. Dicai25W TaxID=3413034 RepID=UPI003BF03388